MIFPRFPLFPGRVGTLSIFFQKLVPVPNSPVQQTRHIARLWFVAANCPNLMKNLQKLKRKYGATQV